jgi:hypothetical protein
MDPHTENEVQRVIKRMFSDRTTLTIAHRLDTVIESDKVRAVGAVSLWAGCSAPPGLAFVGCPMLQHAQTGVWARLVGSPAAAAGG